MAREFSTSVEEVPGQVKKLREEVSETRADPPADGGQGGTAGDDPVGFLIISRFDLRDEAGDIDVHGTARDAGTVFAVQAPGRFLLRDVQRVSQGDLPEISCPDFRRLGGHLMLFRINSHF